MAIPWSIMLMIAFCNIICSCYKYRLLYENTHFTDITTILVLCRYGTRNTSEHDEQSVRNEGWSLAQVSIPSLLFVTLECSLFWPIRELWRQWWHLHAVWPNYIPWCFKWNLKVYSGFRSAWIQTFMQAGNYLMPYVFLQWHTSVHSQ